MMSSKKIDKSGKTGRKKRTNVQPPVPTKTGMSLDHRPLWMQAVVAVVVLLIAICLLYPDLVFQNKILLASDVEAAMSFAKAAHRVMIDENTYPLWNPYLFSGMPSYESLAYNPYVYPLSFITGFLITKLHFPQLTWLLFHILMLGMGVVLLLREYKVPPIPSIMAGALMIWMPNVVAIGANGHGSQACAIAFMPFALLFWRRLSSGKSMAINGSALAIVLGFQMLRAHLQISFYTYGLLGIYVLFELVSGLVDAFKRNPVNMQTLPAGFLSRFRNEDGTSRFSLAGARFGVLLGALLGVVVLSLLLSAVLYIPVHDYSQYSIRGGAEGGGLDYDYATSWSLHPLESLTFILPFAFGFGKDLYFGFMPFTDYPNYLGIIVLVFALAGIFMAKTRTARFLLAVVIISTLVAFGKHFPLLYDPLFKWFPYFNKFRVPVMALIVQQLAVVLLFAFGFKAALDLPPEKGRKYAVRGLLFFLVVLILAVVLNGFLRGGFADSIAGRLKLADSSRDQLALARIVGEKIGLDLFKLAVLGGFLFGALLLYYRKTLNKTVLAILVLGAAIIDYHYVDRNIIHPEVLFKSEQVRLVKDSRVIDRFLEPDPVIDFLKKDKSFFRIMPLFHPSAPFYGEFSSNRYMIFGISSIGGYHAAKLQIYNNLLKTFSSALSMGHYEIMNMLNVKYLVTAYKLPQADFLEMVWSGFNSKGSRRYIYDNKNALPRAFFVDKYKVSKGDQAILALQNGQLDPSETAFLERVPDIEPVSKLGSTVKIKKAGFNEITLTADIASPCILMLSEVYYPRWKVFIDGREGSIIRADYVLRAVALSAGRHDIIFRYDASLIKRSFHVSLAAFLFLILVLITFCIRGTRVWKR